MQALGSLWKRFTSARVICKRKRNLRKPALGVVTLGVDLLERREALTAGYPPRTSDAIDPNSLSTNKVCDWTGGFGHLCERAISKPHAVMELKDHCLYSCKRNSSRQNVNNVV